MDKFKNCCKCGKALWTIAEMKKFEGKNYCMDCWETGKPKEMPTIPLIKEFVNHPDHYNSGKIETIDYLADKLTMDQLEGFCIGNTLKYLSRYRHKNGIEDLKKASWYLNYWIEKSL
jgi:hypothetical protein